VLQEIERLKTINKEQLEAIIKVNNWACGVTDRWYACRILQEVIAEVGKNNGGCDAEI
jgi:hypothetical protein